MTTPRFEVAFDVAPDTDPTSGDWTDLTGRIRETSPVETVAGPDGSARLLLDNRDGQLDPLNGASPYNLVPMRHARITAVIGATTHPVWRGYVDRWPPVWRFADATIGVELVDASVWLALQDAAVDLPAQRTHDRITDLLDLAGWPAALRDIGDGQVWLDPTVQAGANFLRLIDDAVAAEDGDLTVAPDGTIAFRGRHARLDSTSQLTMGGANVRVASAQPAFDGDMLINVAWVELADGTVHELRDTASIDAYGPRLDSARDLPLPWHESVGHADWRLHRYAQPSLSLPTVALTIIDDADLADVLALRIGDLVTFEHTPPSGAIELTGHVEQIAHQSRTGVWRTTLALSPYFGEGPWLTLDDLTLGTLDDGNKVGP